MMQVNLIITGDEIISGRREDKHFAFVRELLAERHLQVNRVQYAGDDTASLIHIFRDSFARDNQLTFVFGGLGATPDDKTRQAVAAALNLPLVRHPQAVAEIEAQFASEAYPIRVRMADFPQGAALIPNPVNRVAGFSLKQHYFVPGFPQMAWPMLRWVLQTHYPQLVGEKQVVERVMINGQSESLWVEWMEGFERQFPQLKLYSLPHLNEDGSRYIELGCVGRADWVAQGMQAIEDELARRHGEQASQLLLSH